MRHCFPLPAELTIYSAMETRDRLLAWMAEAQGPDGGTALVSAADVREVDGAGLQLLAALSRSPQPWRLVDPGEALASACQALGLSGWLDAVRAADPGAGA